jgi:hypothetical protein
MKSISTILFSIVLFLMFQSCTTISTVSTYYQVYSVSGSELTQERNSLIHENEDCKVIYDFWGKGGNPGFRIFNKTDRNIYINLSNSFFINNDIAFDYYKHREFHSPGQTLHEEPIVIIPPHSEKYFSEYSIRTNVIRFCEIKQDYPESLSDAYQYQRDDSPNIFKNIISYSVENETKSIENEFWVSEIINYTEKATTTVSKECECEYDDETRKSVFTVSSPNKFYNTYIYIKKSRFTISDAEPMYP